MPYKRQLHMGGESDVWPICSPERQAEDRGTLQSCPEPGRVSLVGGGLQRSADEEMEVYEANPMVGNIRNNGPEMMRAAVKAAEAGKFPL